MIKAHEGIIASNLSASRDEDVFGEDADQFDMHRTWPKEDALGFGYGDHRCIGEYLAKTEMKVAFGEFFPDCVACEARGELTKETQRRWSRTSRT